MEKIKYFTEDIYFQQATFAFATPTATDNKHNNLHLPTISPHFIPFKASVPRFILLVSEKFSDISKNIFPM